MRHQNKVVIVTGAGRNIGEETAKLFVKEGARVAVVDLDDRGQGVADNLNAEKETSKKDKELLRRLHVKDGSRVIEGAEAFLFVWKKIPKYNFLYKFFKLPIIFQVFKFTYEIVAYFLYLKNKKQLKS